MNFRPTFHCSAFPLLAALVVAGCVTPGVNVSGDSVTLDMAPKPGEGHVVVKVVGARPLSALNAKWKSVLLESKRTGQKIELYDFSGPLSAGSLFFGRIDEGEYEIVQLQSLGPGPGLLLAALASDSQDLRARIGTFNVRAGSLANLGTIVIAPPSEAAKEGSVEYLGGAIGRKSVIDDLERRIKQRVTLTEISARATDPSRADEERALVHARSLMAVLSLGNDAQGSALFGGMALGQVVARDAAGAWQVHLLDSLDDVTYARRLTDGTLIAGLTEGRYAVRKPGQGWKVLSLPGVTGRIHYVDTTAGGGALVVVAHARTTTLKYRSSLDGDIADVRDLTTLDFPARIVPVFSLDDRLIVPYNVPGFSRVVELTIVDKNTLQVRNEKQDFWVSSWQRLPSGQVLISRRSGLSSHSISVSQDKGATWTHGDTSGPTTVYFLDEQRGYGLDVSPGAFSVSGQLMKTTDGGKTWAAAGPALSRNVGGQILYAGTQGEVIVSMGFEAFSTRDDGATWTRILPREVK